MRSKSYTAFGSLYSVYAYICEHVYNYARAAQVLSRRYSTCTFSLQFSSPSAALCFLSFRFSVFHLPLEPQPPLFTLPIWSSFWSQLTSYFRFHSDSLGHPQPFPHVPPVHLWRHQTAAQSCRPLTLGPQSSGPFALWSHLG
jgi:hypothetical protein